MTHHLRSKLTEQFENLDISYSSPSPSKTTPHPKETLRKSLRRAGFPNWRTLRGLSKADSELCRFTLKLNANYRFYGDETNENHQNLFSRAANIIQEIRTQLSEENDDFLNIYTGFTCDDMIHLIYGNNMIERAGQDLDVTIKICRDIFDGKEVNATDIDPRTPEYQAQLDFLIRQGYPDADENHVVRSRREVIQHAKALKYIVDASLNQDQPLTEALIKETHRILMTGIPVSKDDPNDYAGVYRKRNVRAGELFPPAWQQVEREMGILVNNFNRDIEDREKTSELDPFYLAADICQDFVHIHPFQDGNGRMCRLIANAFLIKYAGIVISIGEDDQDRKEYMDICIAGADPELEEESTGMMARFFLEKGMSTLQRLKQKMKR